MTSLAALLQTRRRALPAWIEPLAAALFSRGALGLWGAALWLVTRTWPIPQYFYYTMQPVREGLSGVVLGMWQRWDALHYQRIVVGGYSSADLSAFYPLYPFTARLLHQGLGLDALAALQVVSLAGLMAASWQLWRLAEELWSGGLIRRRALLFLLASPAAFFLAAPYPEGLQLALSIGAYRLARRQRWLGAFGLGFLAGLTHPTAALFSLALGLEAWFQERGAAILVRLMRLTAAAGPGLSALLFLAYRQARGFPPYGLLQYQHWGWEFCWPWQALLNAVNVIHTPFQMGAAWANLAIALGVIGLVGWGFRQLPPALGLYSLGLVLFLLSSTRPTDPFASWGRHSLTVFPLYLILAQMEMPEKARQRLVVAFLALQIYLSAQYFAWVWVG